MRMLDRELTENPPLFGRELRVEGVPHEDALRSKVPVNAVEQSGEDMADGTGQGRPPALAEMKRPKLDG